MHTHTLSYTPTHHETSQIFISTHTDSSAHIHICAYTHTQSWIHTGIHTNICTRTCMHTQTLSYTPTNHETSQIFTNEFIDARA